MSAVARTLAGVAAVCGVACGLAGLVRSAALAGDDALVWELPRWWTDLVAARTPWIVAVVVAVAAAAGVLCLLLAFRQLRGPRRPATVRVGDAEVKLAALERLVAQRLAAEVAGLTPVRVRMAWAGEGWDIDALVDVGPLGLDGLRAHAVGVADAELARATGRGLVRLVVRVRRFVGGGVASGGGAVSSGGPAQKKGLGFTRPL